jgi:hypothetical protein
VHASRLAHGLHDCVVTMARQRRITVQLARDGDGRWIATIPSLGVSVTGATTEEALAQVPPLVSPGRGRRPSEPPHGHH